MKKLLLTAALIALGCATEIFADDPDEKDWNKKERIHCARLKKDGTYDRKNADCFGLCKSKGKWTGRAKLVRNGTKNIVCICGNNQEIPVDCKPGLRHGTFQGYKWNGDYYSEQLPGDGMLNVDPRQDKMYDGKNKTVTNI